MVDRLPHQGLSLQQPLCPADFKTPSMREERKPNRTGHLFSHSETGERGLCVASEQGIKSLVNEGREGVESAPGSFTVTPFLKSLVAVRPIEDN